MAPPRKQAPQPLPQVKAAQDEITGQLSRQAFSAVSAGAELGQVVDEPNIEPVGTEEPPDDIGQYPEVSVQDGTDMSIPVKKCEAWKVVEELSDDEFQVEVANIDGYQMRKCIIRYRINGQLSPIVNIMDQIRYHGEKGFQNR